MSIILGIFFDLQISEMPPRQPNFRELIKLKMRGSGSSTTLSLLNNWEETSQTTSEKDWEREERDLNVLKNKLLYSLQESIMQLNCCLVCCGEVQENVVHAILDRRQKDKKLETCQQLQQLQAEKEQHSSYLFYSSLKLLKQSLQSKDTAFELQKIIKHCYMEMLQKKKLNVINFYRRIRNQIYHKIEEITHGVGKQQPSKEQGQQGQGEEGEGDNWNIGDIDNWIKDNYGNCGMDVGQFYLLDEEGFQMEPVKYKKFAMFQHQFARNQPIIRKIVKNMAKLQASKNRRKISVSQIIQNKRIIIKQQKASENQTKSLKKKTVNYRIRASSITSMLSKQKQINKKEEEKQNMGIKLQQVKVIGSQFQNKQTVHNVILKPIIKNKNRIKLKL